MTAFPVPLKIAPGTLFITTQVVPSPVSTKVTVQLPFAWICAVTKLGVLPRLKGCENCENSNDTANSQGSSTSLVDKTYCSLKGSKPPIFCV